MLNDLRVGLRLLWKDKTFTLASAATLAVCIGANVVLFSIVDHVLLRPFPWPNADRLVLMSNHYPGAGVDPGTTSGVPDYYDRLRETTVFDEQAMYTWANVSMDQNGTPARLLIMGVTPSFFRALGVQAALGRTFNDDEGEPDKSQRVVLSYGFWQSAFGGDPQIVGKEVRLNSRPYTVVGVMPQAFSFLDTQNKVMLWRPLAFTAQQKSDESRHSNSWQNLGLLKAGATVEQAQQQVDALNARNSERFPVWRDILKDARFHSTVVPFQETMVRSVKPTLYLLWGGALFVLLIGCVNVANLVLVRSSARLRELATRVALGASRWRLANQLIIESLVLTTMSAAVGLLVGFAALAMLQRMEIAGLPRANEIRIDTMVAVNTVAIAAVIGIVLGLIPVMSMAGINLATVLTEQGRSGTRARGARVARRIFVVVQVAFAFVLLAGAGLLFASFRQLLAVDPGFRPEGVLTAQVALPRPKYAQDATIVAFGDHVLERLRALPGVSAAGLTDTVPFTTNTNDSVVMAEGYERRPGESLISPYRVIVSPGYFETIGATLVRGRFFDSREGASGQPAAIVDEKLANRFWPNQDPIGRRIYQPNNPGNLMATDANTVFRTVVGVVRDLKITNLVDGNGQTGADHFPSEQAVNNGLTFVVRTSGDPMALAGAVRAAIGESDRDLPVYDVETLGSRMDRSLAIRRSPMILALAFGAVALLLAAIGVYGVLAYLVAQRTKEIGIRLALGSSTSAVFQLVLREGLVLVSIGFLLGVAGIVALKRSLDSLLFGISAMDPAVLAGVTLLLAAVALIASALPARRATRIDPVVALAE